MMHTKRTTPAIINAVIAGRHDYEARTPWVNAPVSEGEWFEDAGSLDQATVRDLEWYWEGFYSGSRDAYRKACMRVGKE